MSPEMMSVTNNQNATYWDLNEIYGDSNHHTESYPLRVFSARAGLSAWLVLFEKDFDYLCRSSVQGFKVVLHTPGKGTFV